MTEIQHSIGDFMRLAERKAGIPNWMARGWQAMEGGCVVTGEVPDGVYTRGPRKGKPRFRRHAGQHHMTIVVSDSEIYSEAAQHESGGSCWNCKGTGEVWAGWSVAEGTKRRTCGRCGGTGKAPGAAA